MLNNGHVAVWKNLYLMLCRMIFLLLLLQFCCYQMLKAECQACSEDRDAGWAANTPRNTGNQQSALLANANLEYWMYLAKGSCCQKWQLPCGGPRGGGVFLFFYDRVKRRRLFGQFQRLRFEQHAPQSPWSMSCMIMMIMQITCMDKLQNCWDIFSTWFTGFCPSRVSRMAMSVFMIFDLNACSQVEKIVEALVSICEGTGQSTTKACTAYAVLNCDQFSKVKICKNHQIWHFFGKNGIFPQLAQHCYVTHIKQFCCRTYQVCQVPQVQFVEKIVEVPEVRIQEVRANCRGRVNQPTTFVGCLPCHVFFS